MPIARYASAANSRISMAKPNPTSRCVGEIPSKSTSKAAALDLSLLKSRLAPTVDEVRQNDFLLRFRVSPYEMTVFADGRAILKGTKDPVVARTLYARYIGA